METRDRIPIDVGFHMGNALSYLAQNYSTGSDAVREAAQNALDEGARKIFISVDCLKASISVYDDGNGAPFSDIEKKFNLIGSSLKLGLADKVGSKGIGNLAALAIADSWELITRDAKNRGPLFSYTFRKAELSKTAGVQVHAEEVPFKSIPGAPFPVTTLLRLTGVDKVSLRQLSDKETIETVLKEAFSTQLRSGKVEIRFCYRDFKSQSAEFRIEASKYRGSPMEEVDVTTPYGSITFAFHHSPVPLIKPVLLVQHRGVYSVPLTNFFFLRILPSELEGIFAKGYFEGEIRVGFCKINPQRSAFEHGPELEVFVNEVEAFAKDVLEPLVSQLEHIGREEKLKRVLDKVVQQMHKFLRQFPNLMPASLRSLTIAKSGLGVPGGEGNEDIIQSGVPSGGKPLGSPPGSSDTPIKPVKPTEPDEDAPDEDPIVRPDGNLPPDALAKQRKKSQKIKAEGKKPTTRPPIQIGSGRLTIQMVHPKAEEDFAWHSRFVDPGIIQVNIVNEKFTEAERRGETILRRYVLLLVHKELTCASLTPPEARSFGSAFERSFLSYWKSSLGD